MTCTSKMIESGHGRIVKAYLESLNQKIVLFFILAALILIVALYAMAHGAYEISIKGLLLALAGNGEAAHRTVVLDIRMPRVVSAIIAGWGLSLSGLCTQSLLRNPLGSPDTLGISQGAAFGAALAIVLFGSHIFSATISAFTGALAAGMIILILATIRRLSGEAIILSGVAMASLFMSGTVLIQYLATEIELAAVVFWTFGDVARSNWLETGIMAAVTLCATAYLVLGRWDLNAFSAGEETARGLGVNVTRARYAGIFVVSLTAAFITAFLGVIAFVGLIAPHVARRLIGDDHGMLIPFSAAIGALLLLTADTVGRLVMGSGSLPVGVVTSFLGAPMFLYLLIRGYE